MPAITNVRSPRLRGRLRIAGAALVILSVGAVVASPPASATGSPVGPVYPAPGSGTLLASGAIGQAGGLTWAFSGVDPSQFTQMAWGLTYPATPATFSFGLDTATLSFDPASSNLAAGTARYTGSAMFPNLAGTTPTLPVRLTVQSSTAMETPAAAALGVDPSVGAVLPVTGDFSVNLLFETSPDGGTTWVPADAYFDETPHPSGATTSSVNGGFWYTPPGAPTVGFSPDPLAFGAVPVGTSTSQSVTVTNTGTAPLAISEIDAGGDYSAPTDDCIGAEIAVGGTCSITVDFTPSVAGTDNGTIQLVDNTATSPDVLSVTGSGAVAGISFSPSPLDFGPVSAGSSTTALLTVSNPGGAALNLTGGHITGPNASDFAVSGPGTCTGPIAPSGSCQLQLSYTPSGPGTQTATLTVTDNTPEGSDSVGLQGEQALTGATFGPASLDFGNVPVGVRAVPYTVTLTSSGTNTLHVHAFTLTGPNLLDFSVKRGSCPKLPFTLAGGMSCTELVRFAPSAVGPESASLVAYDDGGSGTQTVSLAGAGAGATDVAVYQQVSQATATPGQEVSFSIAVENRGPYAALNATLQDLLPAGLEYAGVSSGVTCLGPPVGFQGTVFCTLGTLAPYSSEVVTVLATVEGTSGTTLKNTAIAASGTYDKKPGNNKVTAKVTIS